MTRITTGYDRRRVLQGMAGGVAAAGAMTLFGPAVHAAKTIKIGYVSPKSGPLAAFAEADDFVLGEFRKAVKDGLKLGSQTYQVEIITKDSQSNPNRAAEVTKELITRDNVGLVLVGATPETNNPVSTQCELEQIPCISSVAPWQTNFIARQANPGDPKSWKPFDYTYHYFWGLEDVIAVFTGMWNQVATNKSVGALFPNDGDGNAWGDKVVGFPPVLAKQGFTLTDPGRFQNLTDDFSAQISAFRGANAEIVTGVVIPPDFTTFWNQSQQKGYKPKVVSVAKALLFPTTVAGARQERTQHFHRGVVDAEPSLQVQPDRHQRRRSRQRLRTGIRQAVDPADRLRAFVVRGRRRFTEARPGSVRRGRTGQGDRRHQARYRGRSDRFRLRQGAAVRGEKHRQDAAGRRPMAARRQQVQHGHHRKRPGTANSNWRQDAAVELIDTTGKVR